MGSIRNQSNICWNIQNIFHYYLGCIFGDRDEETCSQWAKEGQLANQCINNDEVREKICCQSCQLLAPNVISGSKRNPESFSRIIIAPYTLLFGLRLIL